MQPASSIFPVCPPCTPRAQPLLKSSRSNPRVRSFLTPQIHPQSPQQNSVDLRLWPPRKPQETPNTPPVATHALQAALATSSSLRPSNVPEPAANAPALHAWSWQAFHTPLSSHSSISPWFGSMSFFLTSWATALSQRIRFLSGSEQPAIFDADANVSWPVILLASPRSVQPLIPPPPKSRVSFPIAVLCCAPLPTASCAKLFWESCHCRASVAVQPGPLTPSSHSILRKAFRKSCHCRAWSLVH